MTTAKKQSILTTTFFIAVLLLLPEFAYADPVENKVAGLMWSMVVTVFGTFMAMGGNLLDWSIELFVIGFGDNFTDTGVGGAVENLWVIVRDLFNLTFIFGLVYLGFKMILGSDDNRTKVWLAHLIIAALLVNFSLYITKLIVDISNILATQIVLNGLSAPTGEVAISTIFADSLGVQGVFSKEELPPQLAETGAFGFVIGSMILFSVAGFVFGAGGMLITIRFAALCLYMALSPLMFLGWVFPQLEGTVRKYWSGFLKRAFFAPIYMLLLYFAGTVLQAYSVSVDASGNKSFTALFAGTGKEKMDSFADTLPPFILSCIFLFAAITVSNNLSADGSNKVMALGKNLAGRARRMTANTAMYVPRRAGRAAAAAGGAAAGTVGRRLSYNLGNSLEQSLNRRQESTGIAGRIARSTFVEDRVRGGARNMQNAKFGRQYTIDEQQARANTLAQEQTNRDNRRNGPEGMNSSDPETAARAAADTARAVAQMPNEELVRQSVKTLTTGGIAKNLSDAQIKTLGESGRFTAEDIKKIKTGRDTDALKDLIDATNKTGATEAELAKASEELSKAVRSFSDERIKGLDKEYRNKPEIAAAMRQASADKLLESDDVSQADKEALSTARKAGFVSIAGSKSPARIRDMLKNTPAQKIPAGVMANAEVLKLMTTNTMMQHLKEVNDVNHIKEIETGMNDYLANHATPEEREMWKKAQQKSDTMSTSMQLNFDGNATGSVILDQNGNPFT